MSTRAFASCLAVGLLAATPALAQPDPGLRARVRDQVREEVEDQVVAALRLDGATAARLKALADRYDAEIANVQRDSGQARRQLKQLLDAGGTDVAALKQLTDRLLQNRARIEAMKTERARAVRQILSPQQYGWLLLSMPRITRAVKAKLWKALQSERQAPGVPEPF